MTGAALFFVPTDFLHSEISRFDARSVGDPPQSECSVSGVKNPLPKRMSF